MGKRLGKRLTWNQGCFLAIFFFKEKQKSVNNLGPGRKLSVLGHAQQSCTGSGAILPRRQRLLRPQHPGFVWGLTSTPGGSCMGSFPRSRKAPSLCPELLQPARVLQAKHDGVHSTCECRRNSLRNVRLSLPLVFSAVMNNTLLAAGWEPGFPEL